jgi:flagellar basal-body rod modification protein FlgD
MSIITSTDDLFASLGLSRQQEAGKASDPKQLGLDTFLKLMVTQLNNQDPFEPMDNGQFLGQIAQFGTVSGLDKLNQAFAGLATELTSGQALQAGALVGREVLAPIEVGRLETGGSVRGRVDLNGRAGEVVLRVTDPVGQLVREVQLGDHSGGAVDFSWDGMTDGGDYAPPGLYQFRVQAVRSDGTEDLQTQLYARVDSVSLGGAQGLTLNLAGLGPLPFNNIRQIH